MSRRRGPADDGPLDPAAIARDDELLADLGGAVSWDLVDLPPVEAGDDPALGLLAALRADVDSDLPAAGPARTAVLRPLVDLADRRRPGRRLGSRTAVAGVVAVAMLSVSGVAAASIAVGERGPLAPINRLLVGDTTTAAERAAAAEVTRHLDAAARHLTAGRLARCEEALRQAAAWLAAVDPDDRAGLVARFDALQGRYDDGYAGKGSNGPADSDDDSSGPGSGDDRDREDDSSGPGSGDDRDRDDDSSGRGSDADDDDRSGRGSGSDDDADDDDGDDDDRSGSGSGSDDDDGDRSGERSGSDDDSEDSDSSGSGSDDDDDDSSGSGSGSGSGDDDEDERDDAYDFDDDRSGPGSGIGGRLARD